MDFSTLCIHSGYKPDCTGSVSAPIYTSTAYAHPGVQQSTGYDYIRTQNPTRESVERCLAALRAVRTALRLRRVWRHWPA